MFFSFCGTVPLRKSHSSNQRASVYLIKFSKRKALSFSEINLYDKADNVTFFNRLLPFWVCVLIAALDGRKNKTFFTWSNYHQFGYLNKIANMILGSFNVRVFSIEDGFLRNCVFPHKASYSFSITKNRPYFSDSYWRNFEIETNKTVFREEEINKFISLLEFPAYGSGKYVDNSSINLDEKNQEVENTLIIVGQVDRDRSLLQKNYRGVDTNVGFIHWVSTFEKYKKLKLKFRPHPLDPHKQETIEYCESLGIFECKKDLKSYTGEKFITRTSLFGLDLAIRGCDVEFYSKDCWINELLSKFEKNGTSRSEAALRAKFYLFQTAHLWPSNRADSRSEKLEWNASGTEGDLIEPRFANWHLIYFLNHLTIKMGCVPESIFESAQLSAEIDQHSNVLVQCLGFTYKFECGNLDHFLICVIFAGLGERSFSNVSLKCASLLLRGSLSESATQRSCFVEELSFLCSSIAVSVSDPKIAKRLIADFWQVIGGFSNSELLRFNIKWIAQLTFAFSAYKYLAEFKIAVRRWTLLANSLKWYQFDTTISSSVIEFVSGIDSFRYRKSVLKDFASSRAGLSADIDAFFKEFQAIVASDERRSTNRIELFGFLRSESRSGQVTVRSSMPMVLDLLLIKSCFLSVIKKPQHFSLRRLECIIRPYIGSQLINFQSLDDFLAKRDLGDLSDIEVNFFRIGSLGRLLSLSLTAPYKNAKTAVEFSAVYRDFIKTSSNVKSPSQLVFLFFAGCKNSQAMFATLQEELTRNDIGCIDPFEATGLTCLNFEEKSVEGLNRIKKYRSLPLGLKNTWNVDWKGKLVECEGVNYYQGFYERISTYFRRYSISLKNPEEKALFDVEIKRADDFLTVLNSCIEFQQSSGLKAKFLLSNSHVSPYFVVKQKLVNEGIGVFLLGPTYSRFLDPSFSNSSSTFKVSKYTGPSSKRAPFLVAHHELQSWKNRHKSKLQTYCDEALGILKDRFQQEITDHEVFSKYHLWRSRFPDGLAIMCLGKVAVDLAHVQDGGSIFGGYKDYIKGVEAFAKKREDVFIFFRPHPHEINPEISLALIDTINSWIRRPTSNVSIIDQQSASIGAVLRNVDVTFIYNGSAILEFNALGFPIIPFSYQARIDYPLGFSQLGSIDDVFDMDFSIDKSVSKLALETIACSFFGDNFIQSKQTRFAAHNLSVNTPAFYQNEPLQTRLQMQVALRELIEG
ncbi:hypothetical protein AB3X55_00145 [Alphaproteobacteria bacterium LSUCC0719]